jgi:hypothetical protein
VRTDIHTRLSISLREHFEEGERSLSEDMKRFFKLFQESTFEGSRAAVLEMRKIAIRQTNHDQVFLLRHSLHVLILSDSEMLSLRGQTNSPLLVLLEFVNPSVQAGNEHALHKLAFLAEPVDYSTHENQLILA